MAVVGSLPQFPGIEVSVSLFQNVSNAGQLRFKIAELPCALIDARSICSMEQIYAAIYRTLIEFKYGKLKTKSLHAECLYCLSPTSNIGEAFKNFGIKDDSKALVAIQIIQGDESPEILDIQGEEAELNDEKLAHFVDMLSIKKIYKLNNFPNTKLEEISRAVVNCIQLRGL